MWLLVEIRMLIRWGGHLGVVKLRRSRQAAMWVWDTVGYMGASRSSLWTWISSNLPPLHIWIVSRITHISIPPSRLIRRIPIVIVVMVIVWLRLRVLAIRGALSPTSTSRLHPPSVGLRHLWMRLMRQCSLPSAMSRALRGWCHWRYCHRCLSVVNLAWLLLM